ncbi:MAG: pyridoxal phosphate-dependent aminotransferase [Deltaproteobacteria bacterium]|nr:pyridoxal phosphate-dependent aminotransferase [Deltaproteobacteria bacterium]
MAISRKIEGFMSQSSWIRKMFEDGLRLKRELGDENVFDFSLGNPNIHIDTPDRFKELLAEVADDVALGVHAYMPNAGFPGTRKAIADYLSEEHSVKMHIDHVVMACGAGGALNVVLKTLLDPGDEVIIPAPYFVEYRFYIDNFDGIPRIVPTHEDFSLDVEAIAAAVTEKTKAVLINSPNNPTGKVYDEDSIRELAAALQEKDRRFGTDIYLISDEPYRDIIFDGIKVPSVFKAYAHSIIATSYSKNVSIPGERIGYVALNPRIGGAKTLMDGLVLSTRILGFVNAPAFMQRVIEKMQGVVVDTTIYQTKRDMLCEGLAAIGYRFDKPQGAFYLFPRSPIDDDVAFVQLLQQKNILTVPGSGFGRGGYFRIAYCVDDRTIANSMKGFEEAFNECQ